MDVSHIFDSLNTAQREAVCAPAEPILVLAGAGSGKTRVLAHRIAWLVQAHDVSPSGILAVTFTNKAAREMRGRIEQLLDISFRGLWVGTFHGIGHRLLRSHYAEAGLAENFEVIDSDDQLRLIKRILKDLELDEAYWPPKQMQWMINKHKEEARRAKNLPTGNDIQQQTLYRVYVAYENYCERNGLIDFSEILLRTLELFRHNQTVRESYQTRFQHVLVDEFQDTNSIQYQWLKIISDKHKNLFAVGDDDQSIYGWRGARVENILSFEKDFNSTNLVRLEQNYRSTGNILNAANAVIAHNSGRMGKNLWTEQVEGEPIRLYAASNEIDEARFVVDKIQNWVQAGNQRCESAILYRSNAQSRVFEEQLLVQGIPYRVYGGLRFFERAEIKDALAYLRLVSNRDSDPAFERIVNHPPRGIGNRTLEIIRELSRAKQISMWQATAEIIGSNELSSRALSAVSQFQTLIEQLTDQTKTLDLAEITDHIIQMSGLMDHFKKDRGETAQARIENLQELVNAARNFDTDLEQEEDAEPLSVFLTHAALEAGENQADEWQDCVQLMSLHSAKGLEFNLVFLCGVEEGLFPHQRSIEEENRLEEERRLCYVGMTRARQQLYLCYAEIRRLYGRENYTQASRFLSEVPTEYIEGIRSPRISRSLQRANTKTKATTNNNIVNDQEHQGLKLGTQVRHGKFGDGIVVNIEGQAEHTRVQINFLNAGAKWLVCSYANLEIVG